MIDKNKYYRIKGDVLPARPVTILTTEARGSFDVFGSIHYPSEDVCCEWTSDGVAFPPVESYLDLVEVTKDEWDAMMGELT